MTPPSAEDTAPVATGGAGLASREGGTGRCLNCGAEPAGPFCQTCGQRQDDLRRPVATLAQEVLASFIDLDGRLRKTIPRLFLNPASLTRDYLAGERMSQTPPLRMLFLALLLAFTLGSPGEGDSPRTSPSAAPASALRAGAEGAQLSARAEGQGRAHAAPVPVSAEQEAAQGDTLEEGVERYAILCLPLAALVLGMLFAFNPRFLMFDHLVFSMHSLTVLVVIFSLVEFARTRAPAAGWLLWLIPVHVFFHLRGVYELSILGTVLRMFVLLVGGFLGLLAFIFIVAMMTGHLQPWRA
jgi:hypothetical protein